MTSICIVLTGSIDANFSAIYNRLLEYQYPIILVTNISNKNKVDFIKSHKLFINDNFRDYKDTRYIQRIQVLAGLNEAKLLGYQYCLKWRTDLYPLELNLLKLVELININKFNNIHRIALTAWRNLSVYPDDFSSIPDLFMFSTIDSLLLIWGDEGIDYSKKFNFTLSMKKNLFYKIQGDNIIINNESYSIQDIYDTHIELYSFLKYRIEAVIGQNISHTEVCEMFFHYIDKTLINYCWLSEQGFRSRIQAPQFNWKSKADYRNFITLQRVGWKYNNKIFYKIYSKIVVWIDIKIQQFNYLMIKK